MPMKKFRRLTQLANAPYRIVLTLLDMLTETRDVQLSNALSLIVTHPCLRLTDSILSDDSKQLLETSQGAENLVTLVLKKH